MTRRTAASSRCAASIPESSRQLRDYFVHDGPIMPSTAVIRRSVFDDVGLFNESLRIGEDTEFCLRVAEKWRFCHVPGAFTFKRGQIGGRLSSRLDALLPDALLVTQQFSSHHPELTSLAGRRMARLQGEGQCRLCDEGRMAESTSSQPRRRSTSHRATGAPGPTCGFLLAPAFCRTARATRALKRPWHALRQSMALGT